MLRDLPSWYAPLLRQTDTWSTKIRVVEPRSHANIYVQPIRQSMGNRRHWLVVLHCLLRLARYRSGFRRYLRRRDQRYALTPNANYPSNLPFAGRTLEETAAIFDGDQHQQDLMAMGGEAATMTMSRGVVGVHQSEDSEHSQERTPSKEYPEYYELQNRQQRFSDDGDSAVIKSRF